MTVKDCLENGTMRLEDEVDYNDTQTGEEMACLKLEIERLNNIINELHSDLKTLWIVLWNMDTEMTGYQSEVFDKYYDEFHKGK